MLDNIYKQSEVQTTKQKDIRLGEKKITPTKPGAKNLIVLTPRDISKLSPELFIEELTTHVNSYKSFIPNPYEIADRFGVPFSYLETYIMENNAVKPSWNMYTQKWITNFYEFCLVNKITDKHYAVQIANQIFKVADTSKRIPDIRIELGKDFFANE